LEKDRERRYETANGLALDLERYLADEPVQACPPSAVYRFRKLVRRNKPAFFATAVVVAALVGATTISIWQAARATQASQAERDARGELEVSAQKTELQRRRAERNAQYAFDAVNEMLMKVALNEVTRFPQMEKMRRELLEQAARFYQGLVREDDPDLEVRYETARAHYHIGRVRASLGQPAMVPAFRKAQESFEKLASQFPAERKYRAGLADVYLAFAHLDLPEQVEALQKAVAIFEQMVAEDPVFFRPKLANAYHILAYRLVIGAAPRYHEAERLFRRALDLQEESDHSGETIDLNLSHICNSLGILLRLTNRPGEAEQMHRRALDHCDRYTTYLDTQACRAERSRSHVHLAFALWAQARRKDAVRHATEALTLQKDGAVDFPLAWPRAELGGSYHNLGQMLEREGSRAEADQAYCQALAVAEKMVADLPEQTDGQQLLVNVLNTLIRFHMHEDSAAADEYFRQMREFEPKHSMAQNNLAWRLATSPEGRYRDPSRAVMLAEKALARSPKNGTYQNTLGVARYRAGDWKRAVAELEQSRELLAKSLDSFNTFFLAMAHWQLGNKDEARQFHQQAVQWMETNQPKDEELRRFRAEAEELLK
jgi:tetratricopeptide (TPR) repeat protein